MRNCPNRQSGIFVVNRRQVVVGAPAALALAALPRYAAAQTAVSSASPHSFDFDQLRQTAKALAAKAYVAPKAPAADLIKKIDFDVVQKIKFRASKALFGGGGSRFPIRLFHLDAFNATPVRINTVRNGIARPVAYSTDDFDYGDTGLKQKLPPDLGFSGFRVMDGPDSNTDWLAFQGASYFRSAGEDIRNDLLGEHLGVTADAVAAAVKEKGSMLAAVDGLRQPQGRTLRPLPVRELNDAEVALVESHIADPERPVNPERLLKHGVKLTLLRRPLRASAVVGLAALGVCSALYLAAKSKRST